MAIARKLRYLIGPGATIDRPQKVLGELYRHGKRLLRQGKRRMRVNGVIALQAGLAAALAWLAAAQILRTPEPVFAPVTAVGAIVASLGRRLRHSFERVAGVVVGIGAGDLLVAFVGTGPWQTGIAVTLAVYGAMLITGSGQLVSQASSTAVLVGALSAQNPDLELPRFLNAVVGGVVGLTVVLLLLPLNPLRVIERAGQPMLARFADQLRETAQALDTRDPERANRALDRNRGLDADLNRLRNALQGARETVSLAPFHRRRREILAWYELGVKYLERAVEDSRPLIRRSETLLRDGEPVPPQLVAAVTELGDAVRQMQLDVNAGRDPERVRERTLRAASAAGHAYDAGVGFSGSVVVAHVRTVGNDLLRASGLDRREAVRMIRRAVRAKTKTQPRPQSHR